MNPDRRALIDELAAYGHEHDAAHADRLRRLRNVETETAELMHVLARALVARRLLELGSSNGYSTLWLGDAAQAADGRLLSVDVDSERSEMAARNLERANLTDVVELRTEDALETLHAQPDASCDFIFLDAERPAYTDYWEDLVRVLAVPGLLVVDNATSHGHELTEFAALVRDDERVASTVVAIGAGAMLIARER